MKRSHCLAQVSIEMLILTIHQRLKTHLAMTDKNLKDLQLCLDEYMMRTGKHEINEMEANTELARAGLLEDDEPHPGRPLREILIRLRDTNLLPQNIKHLYGQWKIRISGTIAKAPMFFQFQYD